MDSRALSLCTYNIHGAIGTDGRFDPGRTLQVLHELNSDIVALQEVEHHRIENTDLPQFLATACDCELLLGPTLLREDRHYGNALLTRLPTTAVKRIDLSVPGREPRGALDVEMDADGRIIRVITTHLGLYPNERRTQVRRLLAHLKAPGRAELTVLAGDINEWFLWGRPVRWLNQRFSPAPALPTFPAQRPLLALDRIWLQPRERMMSVRVHKSDMAQKASDHLPLCVEFDMT